MKPAIRMAALMQLPVKFVWSHDAFRVGEECPIYLVSHDPALANRSIIYSFKDDLDDAGIFVTEFFNDLRDCL